MDNMEEFQAIYAAAHAIQEGAAKAVAELTQLVAAKLHDRQHTRVQV
jgi:hypothetical protein